MYPRKSPIKNTRLWILVPCLICLISGQLIAQDSSRSLLDINNTKLVKKVNSFLDSNQKKINKFIFNRADSVKSKLNRTVTNALPLEIEKPLPYERLLNKKYTLARRAYQNTMAQFNYFFNAEEELKDIILSARSVFQEDYTELLPFYDYDLATTAKRSIDSIIYRCNANIVFHDLRNNWIDDSYLLMAKAYLYHKNFDTAGSILQFINYSFDEKENGADLPIGSNIRNTKGKFSIATPDNNRMWENENVRNESMVWQARNYFEQGELNEGIGLLQLLKSDAGFPVKLNPFLNEQLAYGYYQMDLYENAANYLIKALPNATDLNTRARWHFLIAQLYEKADKINNAYEWYQKASQLAVNPILGVYAKINIVNIEARNAKNNWEDLAASLEKMTKREKYAPYSDIIYFEMAKLALKNKAIQKANDWLISSVVKNTSNLKQKQKAFELLGSINYNVSEYRIAQMAYDSLNAIVKTHPNYEQLTARKKWLSTISNNDQTIQKEDSLEAIFRMPKSEQPIIAKLWVKRQEAKDTYIKDLFVDKSLKKSSADAPATPINFNSNQQIGMNGFSNNGFNNTAANSFGSSNNNASNFYFENPNSIAQGKQSFIQKWGERPDVDNWRRKSSGNVAYKNLAIVDSKIVEDKKTVQNKSDSAKITGAVKTKEGETTIHSLLKDTNDYKLSLLNWNKAALANAQTFLLQLNDFEKALPLYKKIITRNIDPTITERALLDIASQYVHDSKPKSADSIIALVENQFPTGYYVNKKKEAYAKKNKESNIVDDYKEAYFLAQIGNWDSLANMSIRLDKSLNKTKWYTPFQFLKVKMYAQQGQDSAAIALLDAIILENQNEKIKDKAKSIIKEIKNRKDTEAYLANLKITLPELVKAPTEETVLTKDAVSKEIAQASNKAISTKDTTKVSDIPSIVFTNDSTENHYVAVTMYKVKEAFVKEAKTAFSFLNDDDFRKQKLETTYVRFDDEVFIVWIGPFESQKAGLSYIQKVKPRLKNEVLSFIPANQYELYILGKSNILQIKNIDDLSQYKIFMNSNIYK